MTDDARDQDAPSAEETFGVEGFEFFNLSDQDAGEEPSGAGEVSATEEAGDDGADQAAEPAPGEQAAPTVEERLAQLEARHAQEMAQYQATIDRLTQGLTLRQEASAVPPADPEIEFPDILEDPKGYASALREMVRRETSGALRQSTTGQSREERVKAITLKFYEDNADLQGIPEFVNAAYEAEARHYAALGVNIQDALLRDPEAVSRRVADAARSRAVELGLRLGSSETEEDGGSEARPAGFGSRGRTAGVSGRSASKAARNGKAPDGPGDFAAELRREQASSGFF